MILTMRDRKPVITSYSIHYTKLYDIGLETFLFELLAPGDIDLELAGEALDAEAHGVEVAVLGA